jgi:hypothetical protein
MAGYALGFLHCWIIELLKNGVDDKFNKFIKAQILLDKLLKLFFHKMKETEIGY